MLVLTHSAQIPKENFILWCAPNQVSVFQTTLTCCIVNFIILEISKVGIQITIIGVVAARLTNAIRYLSICLLATTTAGAIQTIIRVVDARFTEVGNEFIADTIMRRSICCSI